MSESPLETPEPLEPGARLPWHDPVRRRLARARARGEIPHAVLLHGARGLGKRHLARQLVGALVCEAAPAELEACGACRGCRLYRAGSHPDAWSVAPSPEAASPSVTIAQIRDLIAGVSLTPRLARLKTVIVEPAEAMTRAAANALLKTLEEPPGASLFVLVSDAPANVPATIRSRCQAFALAAPPPAVAEAWLRARSPRAAAVLDLVEGAPVEALRLVRDEQDETVRTAHAALGALLAGAAGPLETAERLRQSRDLRRVLALMLLAAADLARVKLGVEPGAGGAGGGLPAIAERINFQDLYAIVDRIYEARRALEAGVSLNEQLVLEDLALAWAR